MFTRTRYPMAPLSWTSVQSTISKIISLIQTSTASCNLRLRLPNGIFLSGFPTKILCVFFISPWALRAAPISYFLIWSPNNILWKVKLWVPSFCDFLYSPITSSLSLFHVQILPLVPSSQKPLVCEMRLDTNSSEEHSASFFRAEGKERTLNSVL